MELREKIKGTGLKATPQRRLVYQIIAELLHATIEEIITRVHAKSPDITVSTVYRILDSFCSAGLLSRFNHPDGKSYFDINSTEHHHLFIGESEILDFEDSELTSLIKERIKNSVNHKGNITKVSIQVTIE